MNILSIDTSAKTASVCILNEETILSEFSVNAGLTHSQTIMPMCEAALSCARMTHGQIDAFAVSAGPGSFTGVRIGVSAIKGLAMAEEKPCIPVSTLLGLAHNLPAEDGAICAVMDARRNQVYNALFRWEKGNCIRLCSDRAVAISDLGAELKNIDENIFLVGDGADLCYNNLQEELPFLRLAPRHLKLQRATSVGLAAQKEWNVGNYCSANELMPVYLRLSQAERELLEKEQK